MVSKNTDAIQCKSAKPCREDGDSLALTSLCVVFSPLYCYKVVGRKSRFTLLADPRTSHRKLTHRKFTVNIGDEDPEAGDHEEKHRIPAADRACVCYFTQVNSK
jgi:hypothetical protein